MDRKSLPKKNKDTSISSEQFAQLLQALNPDPLVAADQYEQIRLALTTYFSFRGAPDALGLCDEVFDRAMRRLSEGADIFSEQPMSYFYGIARNVWRETLAKPYSTVSLEENIATENERGQNPYTLMLIEEEHAEAELRMTYLEQCLQHLPAKDRELILAYYENSGQAKIENRQDLATQFNISMKTLRNKTTLLRAKLAECLKKRLQPKQT